MIMSELFKVLLRVVVGLVLLALQVSVAFAQQTDIAGEWMHPSAGAGGFGVFEDVMDRGAGPDPGQWLGIPFNDAGRLKAQTWNSGWQSIPEHQCEPHSVMYQLWGPGTLTIRKEYDSSRRVIAYRLDGTYGIDRIIWIDGRPHPPADALYSYPGFSTGKWDGDSLLVETTHFKPSYIRRNGAVLSEKARMLERFARRGIYLIHTMVVEDPVYLTEPFVRTTEYQIDPSPPLRLGRFGDTGDEPVFYKCFPTQELGGDPYRVPHWLPGRNPMTRESAAKLRLPESSLLGGPETMYPEYMSQLSVSGGPPVSRHSAPRVAQPEVKAPEVRSMHVKGKVWVITGAGATITVQVGDEGVLLVDSGVAAASDAVRREIDKLAPGKPIRYVINTHWHPDHTGGNVSLSRPSTDSQRAAIMAHERVYASLSKHNLPAGELDMDTFFGKARTIYFNDEPIEIINVAAAHTDGDTLVFFRKSDVVSVGDIFGTYGYPRIDKKDGGTVDGTLNALNRIIDIAVAEFRQQGGTIVIPGHGRLCDETDVVEYRDMLSIVRDRVRESVKAGKTLDQVKAERPTLDYDGLLGADAGDWTTDMFLTALYESAATPILPITK
jgi:cyclase